MEIVFLLVIQVNLKQKIYMKKLKDIIYTFTTKYIIISDKMRKNYSKINTDCVQHLRGQSCNKNIKLMLRDS